MTSIYAEKRKLKATGSDLENSNSPTHKRHSALSKQKPIATLLNLTEEKQDIQLYRSKELSIGRSSKCDVRIQGEQISSVHCSISWLIINSDSLKSEYFYITDLSTNGVYINNEIVGRNNTHVLQPGDNVRFSRSHVYVFRFESNIKTNSIFDDYRIGKTLGSGHYAVVKEAFNRVTGDAVAIKIFHPNKNQVPDKEKFNQEIKLLLSIKHTNIVMFIATYIVPQNNLSETNYLVLEKINSGELFQRIIKKTKLRQNETKAIFKQLLTGLLYLHDNNIIHRDIKPENILLEITHKTHPSQAQTGPWDENELDITVKIADFGLAKFIGELKFTDTLCGTPAYVAPEILLRERKYSKSVDLWSAGTLLYVCLVGFPPFSEELAPPSMREQILQGKYSFFAPYFDNISDSALDLISRLLVVKPTERLNIHQTINHQWFQESENFNVPPIDIAYVRNETQVRVPVRFDTQPITLKDKYLSDTSSKKQFASYDDSQGLATGINLSDMSMELI